MTNSHNKTVGRYFRIYLASLFCGHGVKESYPPRRRTKPANLYERASEAWVWSEGAGCLYSSIHPSA
jgi:hypothetical protein